MSSRFGAQDMIERGDGGWRSKFSKTIKRLSRRPIQGDNEKLRIARGNIMRQKKRRCVRL